MASNRIEMYAEKKYELEEIKDRVKEECNRELFSHLEFKGKIIELGF